MVGYEDVKTKKSMINRIQDFLNSIVSIFIKKQKALPKASETTNAEYEKIKDVYEEITKEDSFENFKKTYENYRIGTNTDGKTVAVEKITGYVIEEPKFVARVRFLSAWRKSAIGNQDTKDEDASVEECFNTESQKIYEQIKELAQRQLLKTGNIDTLEILNVLKNSEYKWARSTSRRLFRNEIQAEIVTDFFRSLTPKAKKQSKKTFTTSQALYGLDEEI